MNNIIMFEFDNTKNSYHYGMDPLRINNIKK